CWRASRRGSCRRTMGWWWTSDRGASRSGPPRTPAPFCRRTMPITLDYNNMLAPRLGGGHGIEPDRLAALQERFEGVHADVQRRREAGELGFFSLPSDSAVVDEIERFADGGGQAFSNVVVLGI